MAHGLVPWAECFSLSHSLYLSSLWGIVSAFALLVGQRKGEMGGRHKKCVVDAGILCSQLNSRPNNPFGQTKVASTSKGKKEKKMDLSLACVHRCFCFFYPWSLVHLFCVLLCASVSHTQI